MAILLVRLGSKTVVFRNEFREYFRQTFCVQQLFTQYSDTEYETVVDTYVYGTRRQCNGCSVVPPAASGIRRWCHEQRHTLCDEADHEKICGADL